MTTTLLLPTPMSRARLRAFWTALCLLAGVLVALLAALVPSRAWLLIAALLVAALVFGLVRPYAVQLPYRAWNFGVRRLLEVATTYVTAVCSATVLWADRSSSRPVRFEHRPRGTSTWKDRGTQPAEQYASQFHAPADPSARRWSDRYRAWAIASGRPTATALLPFLVLLRFLDPEPDAIRADIPTNIYTLY